MSKKKNIKDKDKKELKTKPRINQRLIYLIFGIAVVAAFLISQFLPWPAEKKPANKAIRNQDRSSVFDFRKEGEVKFLDVDGELKVEIDVEIADDPGEITLGLMYRDDLDSRQGMLFIFEDEQPRSFWMRNTILPLDMIFADSSGKIVTIHEHTVPYSKESYISTIPAQYVVEVNAGFVNSHNINIGDKIEWRRDNREQKN
ncbi:MAG TPA: DUF192 domain-containing protein [candidate division Zixibacteria bacterium]|nr:DUF192 domain-containing protein [candidate division Zixibacteria bacterium]HER00469.1 DUF192 domain-containing protein [candidate division Zixibacteria bacterium]